MPDGQQFNLANGDVRTILSAGALAKLREVWGREPDALTRTAHDLLIAPYPPTGDPFNALGDHAYGQGMPPRQRERCVIAVLTAKDLETGFLLPMHFYWGLMEGLEASDIAETIFLSGMYSGIANYMSSISRFQSILQLLAELFETRTSDDELKPVAVAGQIRRLFSYMSQREDGKKT
jgi:alkylhydroperoxidase/carboxymuconolactone decarboxylase family protein YurZ